MPTIVTLRVSAGADHTQVGTRPTRCLALRDCQTYWALVASGVAKGPPINVRRRHIPMRACMFAHSSHSRTPSPRSPQSPSPSLCPSPGPPLAFSLSTDILSNSIRPDLPPKVNNYFEASYVALGRTSRSLVVPSVPATEPINKDEF
jgi:hypothetical protein